MERFSSPQRSSGSQSAPQPAGTPNNESFSEMADATAKKSGLVGKLLIISLIVVSIAVTAFVGVAIFSSSEGEAGLVKTDQYQAVFLSDGQIYFGKVTDVTAEYMVLEDIYYLQVEQQVQPERDQEQQAQPRVSLAKLGNELHGPEDQMFISRLQVLFWENLKTEGQVTKAITDYVNNGGNTNNQQQQNQEQNQNQ